MKQVDVITSHNISIEYEAASLVNRGVALFIDLLIQTFYYIASLFILSSLNINIYSNDIESFIIIFMTQLPVMFYSLYMHFILKGQTIGKLAVGIRVVKLNGHNATISDYTLLWTFRLVDFWFSLGAIGALFISTTEKGQRLGDVLAETAVIRNKPEQLYAISDILSIKDRSKHTPTYLAVSKFTDEDMILIKNAITRVKKYPNEAHKQFIRELASKAADELKLDVVPEKKLTFLKTLLQDYIVLTR
ncbi:RDD family protein [Crocinitomix catalasitica]|uniref:RDD family protein n=1 Tax=Crocinitomix catalasitica TaxID=184607 RepID=UPI00047F3DA1|nr:RDD family protein [Crocinitomix catalasitica]